MAIFGDHLGEWAAVGAAGAWAAGSLIFSRVRVPAAAINLFKNTLASVVLLATLLLSSVVRGQPVFEASAAAWGWLVLSSIAGLVIGDTCYFRSLQILGARRGLVMITFAPPLSGLFGWFFLGESLSAGIAFGMALTLAGVVWVVRERGVEKESAGHFPGTVSAGVFWGLGGALGQALGAVGSKVGIQAQAPELGTLEASFIRLVAAALIGLLLARLGARLGSWIRLYRAQGVMIRLIPASICGSVLGIWLSLVGFKHAHSVAVATTLTSLTPVLVLPLVWIFLRQRISLRAFLGALLAVAGVSLLFLLGGGDAPVMESQIGR